MRLILHDRHHQPITVSGHQITIARRDSVGGRDRTRLIRRNRRRRQGAAARNRRIGGILTPAGTAGDSRSAAVTVVGRSGVLGR